jgi:hypothetical protein
MASLRLDDLRAEVRYHRERRDLYRAKVYGPRPTSPARLKELERAYALSSSRLRRLQRDDVGGFDADRPVGSVLREPSKTRLS